VPQVTTADDNTEKAVGTEPRDDRRDRAATQRLCALTRRELPTSELLRFVAGPDERIYLDLARRLPGRGVWITADRESVAAAIKSGAFQRSLKRQVEVPPDLAEQLEGLLIRRAAQSIAMVKKAGCLVTGFDKVSATIERGDAAVLVHGMDAASGGRHKLDLKLRAVCKAGGRLALIFDCLNIDELSLAIGRPNVVHAALKPGGVTDRFIEDAVRLAQYRLGVGTGGDDRTKRTMAGATGSAHSGDAAAGGDDPQAQDGEAAS